MSTVSKVLLVLLVFAAIPLAGLVSSRAVADAPAPSTQPKFIVDSCANNGILILWVLDVEDSKILMYSTNAQGKDFSLHAIRTIKADLAKPDFGDGK